MPHAPDRARRDFLLNPFAAAGAANHRGDTHISSAVVTVRPERAEAVARAIAALPGAKIHAVEGAKIVVVMEGPDSGALGANLVAMSLMDGVFSANMVFEQIVPGDQARDEQAGGSAA